MLSLMHATKGIPAGVIFRFVAKGHTRLFFPCVRSGHLSCVCEWEGRKKGYALRDNRLPCWNAFKECVYGVSTRQSPTIWRGHLLDSLKIRGFWVVYSKTSLSLSE